MAKKVALKKTENEVVDTENKSVVETKTDETLQEMNKIADEVIENIDVNNVEVVTEEAPVVTEEETVVTEEETVVTEEAPVVTEEETVVTEEAPVVTEEETEEAPVVTEEETEEETTVTDDEKLEEVKMLLRQENLFSYVSFGRHLTNELTTSEIKKFSDEFINSGMLSTSNHYKLLSLLKELFPKK